MARNFDDVFADRNGSIVDAKRANLWWCNKEIAWYLVDPDCSAHVALRLLEFGFGLLLLSGIEKYLSVVANYKEHILSRTVNDVLHHRRCFLPLNLLWHDKHGIEHLRCNVRDGNLSIASAQDDEVWPSWVPANRCDVYHDVREHFLHIGCIVEEQNLSSNFMGIVWLLQGDKLSWIMRVPFYKRNANFQVHYSYHSALVHSPNLQLVCLLGHYGNDVLIDRIPFKAWNSDASPYLTCTASVEYEVWDLLVSLRSLQLLFRCF